MGLIDDGVVFWVFLKVRVQVKLLVDVDRRLLGELREFLSVMRMIRTSMHDQILSKQLLSRVVLGNHSFDSKVDDFFRIPLKLLPQSRGPEATGVPCVPVIQFVV